MSRDSRPLVRVPDPVRNPARAPNQACSRGPAHDPDLTRVPMGPEQHGGLCCARCSRSVPSEAASEERCRAARCWTSRSEPERRQTQADKP